MEQGYYDTKGYGWNKQVAFCCFLYDGAFCVFSGSVQGRYLRVLVVQGGFAVAFCLLLLAYAAFLMASFRFPFSHCNIRERQCCFFGMIPR